MALPTNELLSLTTRSLQAQEKLVNALKREKKNEESSVSDKNNFDKVVEQSKTSLELLRSMKSELEGSCVHWTDYTFDERVTQQLKQLTLMHIPTSVTDDTRQEFCRNINSCFEGKCRSVLFSCLVTCPWYSATQDERGQQAKHNILLVVFVSSDEEYFCPVDLHKKEENCVIDLGWMYAVEVSHFAQYLSKGKARFVELLFMPDCAVVLSSPEWRRLIGSLDLSAVLGHRGFIEECRGQAVGVLGKKSKSGIFKLRDSCTLYQMCHSCRLLQYVSQGAEGKHLNLLTPDVTCSSKAQTALDSLTALYKEDRSVSKTDIFSLIMEWRKEVDGNLKGMDKTASDLLTKQIGQWLADVRCGSVDVRQLTIDAEDTGRLRILMDTIGGRVSKMKTEQILMIAQAGSTLYNLATAGSDVDYVVIYTHLPQEALSSCGRLPESSENRGPALSFEYGAYEARLFCEMLWKGSVVILELLFSDNLEYTGPAWQKLAEHRQAFVTETAIRQYLGLIRNNMVMIENKKHMGTKRERKLFYQVFHKLYSLDYMLNGKCPPVRCSGEEREFIMRIRQDPLEDDLSRDALYELASNKIKKFQDDLASRECRLPENVDPHILTSWIMEIRGWPAASSDCDGSSGVIG